VILLAVVLAIQLLLPRPAPAPARALMLLALIPAHLRAEVAKTERPAMPAPTPDAVSTKSAQSSSPR
jgi:hypothetical protein